VTADPLPSIEVPRLRPTDRLVELPARYLVRAGDGARPGLRTSVRLGVRGGDLLVRFDGRDRGVVATLRERDAPLWKEDVFEVFLSPQAIPTVYYEFEVNPLGALFDARVESPEGRRETMRVEVSWNCPGLSARVERRPDRWSAVLRIPLGPLSAVPAESWRANFFRIDRGPPEEYSAWSPTGADPPDFHRPACFGWLRMK
jgi:hypothetical protein